MQTLRWLVDLYLRFTIRVSKEWSTVMKLGL